MAWAAVRSKAVVLLLLTFCLLLLPLWESVIVLFCCTLFYVHSSIAIILMLIALLNLSSWCLVMVERLFLAVPRGCLQFVIVVFPDHTHLLFLVSTPIGCTSHIETYLAWMPASIPFCYQIVFRGMDCKQMLEY